MHIPKLFFSRKNIMIVGVAVFSMYIALWATVLIVHVIDGNREKHAASLLQKQYDALNPAQKAALKAEKYINGSIGTFQIEQRLILDFLQRKFSLEDSFSATKNPFPITENPKTYPQEINFLARISYPDKLVTVPPRNAVDGPILTNIYSANCDHMKLPANFWPTMDQNYAAGGYYLTHIALALEFMKENGCQIPAAEANLQDKVVQSMVNLAGNSETNPDLRYEAIAFLGLSGHAALIQNTWIDTIVAEQKGDGSWIDGKDIQNRDHTTTLALWALLEHTKPNVPHEPLIHHTVQTK